MQIGNRMSDTGYWSAGSHDYSLHDMIFDGLHYSGCYACGSYTLQIGPGYSSASPPPSVLHDLALDHITMITANKPSLTWMLIGGPPANNVTGSPQVYNVSLTNFIVSSGPNGLYSTGGGSTTAPSRAQVTMPGWFPPVGSVAAN